MDAHVNEQLISGIELLFVALAVRPQTEVAILFARILIDVPILKMLDKLLHILEGVVATFPLADVKFALLQKRCLLLAARPVW